MFFRQILHEDLGCASYVIADGGEAAVVDPKWRIEDYLELAHEHDFRIRHVLETHNHADHLSGHGRLAAATGATLHVSAQAGAEHDHEPLEEGTALELGDARITAVRTPGHRPEHLAFVVEDRSREEVPWLLLTGDSLFVGDVARPDLAVEPEEGARGLHRSLDRLLEHEDFVEVWPGHVGGSLCGGAGMSEKPGSTIGFERRFNPLLRLDEGAFVRELVTSPQPQPPNFERIVALNRGPLVTETVSLEPLAPAGAKALLDAGAVLVDGREPREFDAIHVPGSLSVTQTHSGAGTRAAWVVEADDDVVVLAASDADAVTLARNLEAIGFRNLNGFVAGGIAAWQAAGLKTESTPAIDPAELARRLHARDVTVLDVREDDEWEEGHVEGSLHVPYHELRDGVPADLPRGEPLAVACSAGNRSSLAASLLRRAGLENVIHVTDGGVEDLLKGSSKPEAN
ncbi:MAG: MBL fold metallo-hydrolase [Actinobacteria bacterium]|nr:MAG: MBL fold metallo-hydrolase [Actinomycetota bacterium]